MEQYSWKAGVQFPVKAEVAAATIKQLQTSLAKETVTAQELLDASRDADAPLHSCFEWDDAVAAENFRRDQARKIIGSIEVTIIKSDKKPATTRLFVNVQTVKPRNQGEFVTIHQAMTSGDWRQQVLRDALRELRNFQRKYAIYSELADVFKSIDVFADAIT